MKLKLRIKREEVARLRVLRGFRSEAALARACGLTRQWLSLLFQGDPSRLRLGTLKNLLEALSTVEDPVFIEDLIEVQPLAEEALNG